MDNPAVAHHLYSSYLYVNNKLIFEFIKRIIILASK